MANIPFDHEGCDAWAIVDSRYIDATSAQNIHIVEGTIVTNETGEVLFSPNSESCTICGEGLKSAWKYRFCSTDPAKIRSTVTALQNGGHEVCGTCVSRFYVDQVSIEGNS